MKAAILSLMVLASTACVAQNKAQTNYDDGALKSEYVKSGSELVAVTNYYKDGQVKETGYFKDGIPDGKWVSFSADGAKTAELNYADGKRHGEFRVWDEFTGAYMEIHYANGEIINADRYVKDADFAVKDK